MLQFYLVESDQKITGGKPFGACLLLFISREITGKKVY